MYQCSPQQLVSRVNISFLWYSDLLQHYYNGNELKWKDIGLVFNWFNLATIMLISYVSNGHRWLQLCWTDHFQNMDKEAFFRFNQEGTIRRWQVIIRHSQMRLYVCMSNETCPLLGTKHSLLTLVITNVAYTARLGICLFQCVLTKKGLHRLNTSSVCYACSY